MLTFAHIWIFWLAPLPLLVWWLVPARAERTPAIRVPFVSRLQAAGGGASSNGLQQGPVSFVVRGLVWLLVLSALARPQWLERPIERVVPTRDLLLLVDLSGSMEHKDFTNATGQPVNRLDAVKEVLGDFFLAMNRDELSGIYKRLDEIDTREVKTVSHRPRRDLYFWPLAAALLVSLATHSWKLLTGRAAAVPSGKSARLRVNTQTFELETLE
ncbi:MAG: hypothetical protein ABGZ23_24815 [Fuerstiella sp.]